MGVLCFVCGRSLECWPLEKLETLLDRHRKNASFRAEVARIRSALEKGIESGRDLERQAQSVNAELTSGLRIVMYCGFVEKQILERHVESPPEKLGLQLVTVQTPEGAQEGVLLALEGLPADLPRWTVQLYTDVSRSLSDVLLSSDDVLREGQARERYTLSMRNFSARSSVNVAKARKPLLYETVMHKAKELQKELAATEQAVQDQTTLQTKTSTGLADSLGFGDMKPPPVKGLGRSRARGGAAAPRGRGRPAHNPSPSIANLPSMPAQSALMHSGRSVVSVASSRASTKDDVRSVASGDDASSAGGAGLPPCDDYSIEFFHRILKGWNPGRSVRKD